MTLRLLLLAGLLLWAGTTLLLAGWTRFARPGLAERLAPFHAGAGARDGALGGRSGGRAAGAGGRSVGRTGGSVAEVGGGSAALGDLVREAGDRLAAVFGVREGAARRLARVHSDQDPMAFRLRQAAVSCVVGLAVAGLASVTAVSPALGAAGVIGGFLLAFLVVEQRLTTRSDRWRATTEAEVPIVAEQMAMLLGSGASVGVTLHRIAARGHGCVARDLDLVVNRIAQGLSEADALREWADRAGVDGVTRLVGVLTLHSEAADLGRLVTAEARRARREMHRRTLEEIERRGQQVWVPVAVATLVPGAILLAVPFLAALRLFGGT